MGGYWNSSDFESQFRIFCGPSGKR
jgi:hypothetical protein